MASSSWCKETDEKINYTKLCRLLVDGGTQAVRSVFDRIHPSPSLKANLNANKTTLQKLKKPKGKVLNNEQWDKLYPTSGSAPISEDFDITLLFVLLRNICGLTAPATGWDVLPPVTADNSLEANLSRIKYYRNNTIAHKPNTEINNADFEQHWQDISSALLSLGLSQDDIDDFNSAHLGEKDYNQLLDDWSMTDKDIKIQLEVLKSDTADMKSDTADVKDKLDDIRKVCIEAKKMDQLVNKLAFSDFSPEIRTKCKSFHPNTRQWILDQVESHVDSDQPDSRIMLITAGPGMGKSTIAVKICQTYKDLGYLAGCHFFQFSNSTRNNPRLMLQSIARQMCDTVPGYREALEIKLQTDLGKKISNMNCEELLTILLEEPLCNVAQTDSNFVVVIDALDECPHDPKDELLKALRKKLPYFPSWLRFILTSRPSTNTSALGSTVAVEIRPEDESNLKDLEIFLYYEMENHSPHTSNQHIAQVLVEMTKGLFLVAFFVIEHMKKQNIESPIHLIGLFPKGISSVYEMYFSRLKEVLLPYISEGERFHKMLEVVVAAENPIQSDMLYDILGLKSEHEVSRQKRKTRKDALNSLHLLFPEEDDHVKAFHKTVFDWLICNGDDEHDFSVRVEDWKKVLTKYCHDVLSDIRNGKKDLDEPLNLSASEKYAIRYGLELITESSTLTEDEKASTLFNLYILTAKLCQYTYNINDVSTKALYCQSFPTLSSMHNLPYDDTIDFTCKHDGHQLSCPFSSFSTFGRYLKFVAQIWHARDMCYEVLLRPIGISTADLFLCYRKSRNILQMPHEVIQLSPKPLDISSLPYRGKEYMLRIPPNELSPRPIDILTTHDLPYCETRTLLQISLIADLGLIGKNKNMNVQMLDMYCVKENFITTHLLLTSVDTDLKFTVLATYQMDGENTKEKWYEGEKKTHISLDKQFIMVTEVLDVTTLEVVSQYESPHNAIETCHVFGDDHGCFIVTKGCQDNKVYIIEGLTGQVRNTITVTEGSTVMDVSCQGHIVVTRTWYGEETDKTMLTDKNDNNLETMNWKEENLFKDDKSFVFREMSIYNNEGMVIPVYPPKDVMCHCNDFTIYGDYIFPNVRFSEDGCLLAFHYKDSIFIVNSSDGSLFKRVFLCPEIHIHVEDILFVSERHLLLSDSDFLFVFGVQKNTVEHTICLPEGPFLDLNRLSKKDWENPIALIVRDLTNNIHEMTIHNLVLSC